MNNPRKINPIGRRSFIADTLKTVGAVTLPAALLSVPGIGQANNTASQAAGYTVQDIINIILKEIPGAPFPQTVDTIKSGKPDQQVTGIVTTMFPTINLIKEAIKQQCNFIIAHEPSYYNHADDTNWVAQNEVLKQKIDLLQKNQVAIWRFHDYWHSCKPDGIGYGVLKNAGWLSYYQSGKMVFSIPPVTLKDLVGHLKSSLNIAHLRVIGDLAQTCVRIGLIPGAASGQTQVSLVEKEKPDVLIVGELREWETAEYIRDGRLLGSGTALIVLGHAVSEEPGMEWLVHWLDPKIPGMKIIHVASGDPFTWM